MVEGCGGGACGAELWCREKEEKDGVERRRFWRMRCVVDVQTRLDGGRDVGR